MVTLGDYTIKTTFKMLIAAAFAFLFAAVSVSAYGADPYDGVNRIGTYYQQSRTVSYSYGYGGYQYE